MSRSIVEEFAGLDLKDKRLNRRALAIAERLAAHPEASFPRIFGPKSAELEGFYRLIESPYVAFEALHQPHVDATLARFGEQGDVIVAHDSSSFDNAGVRALLKASKCGEAGFVGHFSLALRESNHEPLGLLHASTWLRSKETRTACRKAGAGASEYNGLPSEMDHWLSGILATEDLNQEPGRLIHVCDSEADSYALMAPLVRDQSRFVFRACYDRRLQDTAEKLRDTLPRAPLVATRQVNLAKRTTTRGTSAKTRNRPREQRFATLEIRCTTVTVLRPENIPVGAGLPKALELNVVHVCEPHPQEGCPPVDWVLLTTEPIADAEQVLRIVDIYRARWTIEEFFKALKTGCAYEARQLESLASLRKAMAFFVPIAWLMLHTRFLSRQPHPIPAEEALSAEQLEVLRWKLDKPIVSARDALYGIAALGGHIKNNGNPGWQVLWRGLQDLLRLVEGAALAHKSHQESRQRCDQL